MLMSVCMCDIGCPRGMKYIGCFSLTQATLTALRQGVSEVWDLTRLAERQAESCLLPQIPSQC